MSRIRNLPAQLLVFIVLPLTLLLTAVAFGGLSLQPRQHDRRGHAPQGWQPGVDR